MKVYYAHPMVAYGTRREQEELDIIRRKAPDAEVINPARYSSDPSKTHEHMEFYHGLVDECDVVVYSDVEGEFISAGVGEEVSYALEKGKPVYRIDHKTRRLVRVHGEAKHLSRTGTRLLYRTMKWSGFRGEDLNKMVRMKIAEFGGRLSEEDALLMVAADLGVNTKTFLNNALKEAPEQIKAEKSEKPSIYTPEDYASTSSKHLQEQYTKYQEALRLYRGGMTKSAIAGKLGIPKTTIRSWINERNFPIIERNIRELRNLGLYHLTPDNPHLPFIALQASWIIGDGHLKRNLYNIQFFDGEKASLENLKAQFQEHFPKLSTSNIKKDSFRNAYMLEVYNTALAHLFAALGVPVGDKIEVPYSVPHFVLNGSREVKRYFLGGLLGSEMSTPKLAFSHSAEAIRFSLSKIESLEKEHLQFMEQVRELLNEFGITTSEVRKVTSLPPANPKYRFSVHNRAENLIKFFDIIPFEFFAKKHRGGEVVVKALKYHIERAELYHRALALKAEGKKAKEISDELNVNLGTIYTWINGKYKPILANNAEKT